jgi:deoxyribonuclease IV
MPFFGAHFSIAGGTDNAALRAREVGADCFQLFVKSPSQWRFAALTDEEVGRFKAAVRGDDLPVPPHKTAPLGRSVRVRQPAPPARPAGGSTIRNPLSPLVGHASYLVNLASPDDALYERSRQCLLEELDRAERLGLDDFVLHPGAHMGSGEEAGLGRIATALTWLHEQRPGRRTRILLENTAGAGTVLAGRFEHLGYLIRRCNASAQSGDVQSGAAAALPFGSRLNTGAPPAAVQSTLRNLPDLPDRQAGPQSAKPFWLGVCIDTCHLFAAGYDLRTAVALDATLAQLDAAVGLDRVRVIHANDCRGGLGSHLDRHAHIGRGHLGSAAFRLLVNHPALRHLPFIIETPKEDDSGREMDPVNLKVLRRLVER